MMSLSRFNYLLLHVGRVGRNMWRHFPCCIQPMQWVRSSPQSLQLRSNGHWYMLTHLACIFVLSQQVDREDQLHKPSTWLMPAENSWVGCGASLASFLFFSLSHDGSCYNTYCIVHSTPLFEENHSIIRLTRMQGGFFVNSSDARTLFWVRLAAAKRCDLGAKIFSFSTLKPILRLLSQYESSLGNLTMFRHDLCTPTYYQSHSGYPLGLHGRYSLSPLLLEAPAFVRHLGWVM